MNNKPIIYGITNPPETFGVQAYAIDEYGNIITQHFCSSEYFAKSDLGFTDVPILNTDVNGDPHSTKFFHSEVHKIYADKFPDGYNMVWLGLWTDHPEIVKLKQE